MAYIINALTSFHLLRASEQIKFKLAVIVYQALHGTTSRYLSDTLSRVADISSWSRLRLLTSSQLMVCQSCLVTVRERSFASAGPRLE